MKNRHKTVAAFLADVAERREAGIRDDRLDDTALVALAVVCLHVLDDDDLVRLDAIARRHGDA